MDQQRRGSVNCRGLQSQKMWISTFGNSNPRKTHADLGNSMNLLRDRSSKGEKAIESLLITKRKICYYNALRTSRSRSTEKGKDS